MKKTTILFVVTAVILGVTAGLCAVQNKWILTGVNAAAGLCFLGAGIASTGRRSRGGGQEK